MRIYSLSFEHNEHGNLLSYHPSKRDAMRAFAQAKREAKEHGDSADDPIVRMHSIQATKYGFLQFLNHWTPKTDNG